MLHAKVNYLVFGTKMYTTVSSVSTSFICYLHKLMYLTYVFTLVGMICVAFAGNTFCFQNQLKFIFTDLSTFAK